MTDLFYSGSLLFLGAWAGGGVALFLRSNNAKRSRLFLSFSGAFLFALAITRFLPTLFQEGPNGIGAWVLIGFLLQILLDFLSGGVEHGHVQEGQLFSKKGIPFAALAGLSLHALLESIPLGGSGILQGDHFLMGLLVHKLPASLALAGLLINSSSGHTKPLIAFSIFSLMGPLGILIGKILPADLPHLTGESHYYMLALVLGVLLHVSTTILFESSDEHRLERFKLIAVLAGFLLGIFF